MSLNVVLYQPEIPQNTGNIARTCAATGTALHLIHPLGFSVEDKYLRRAGLDYWELLDIHHYHSWEEFLSQNGEAQLYFATTKAKKHYAQVDYGENTYLVFGPESRGLPEELLVQNRDQNIRIPMKGDARSLNLSNAVAILVYEALRQQDFPGLTEKGTLHRLTEPTD
ncbi:MAG: tRNA (uridine(34)/cytosine(34)/5-carboxymethylaminomethyluridine(34)-2'-O)-methyltransferase TrmL [Spirochaetales bacterium]|nr:tRNA (uridine(34)/cytosine(34)/5-carboxymethylaminomethyluridine(34)-2'-O)-methyltransferase TrmL [Spirochaetales bacterium]